MSEQHSIAQGWAAIRDVFRLTGMGLVLVFEKDFDGTIPLRGTVRSDRGTSAYTGPEFVDGWDASGTRTGWVAVIATASDAPRLFQPGDMVALFP